MRDLLKRHLPTLFELLRRLYRLSFLYRRQQRREMKRQEQVRKERAQEDDELLTEIFANQCVVHNGPFQGMKYIRRASGSALLPKLLGSYEEPIHEWIYAAIQRKYARIIDIGCAEGYYTVGFAIKSPSSDIYAFDIDSAALENARELAELNGVVKVVYGRACGFEELNHLSQSGTLVFCDIEGFESTLLDPERAPNLIHADLLVECHDFLVEATTETLIKRFRRTHRIRVAVDYRRRLSTYVFPVNPTEQQRERVINEFRQEGTTFLFMERIA